jgi:hypothetical protein
MPQHETVRRVPISNDLSQQGWRYSAGLCIVALGIYLGVDSVFDPWLAGHVGAVEGLLMGSLALPRSVFLRLELRPQQRF